MAKSTRSLARIDRLRRSLRTPDPTARLILLGLCGLSLGLLAFFAWNLLNSLRVHKLTIAAGSKDGESYILSKAIEQVVEQQHPNIQIDVIETGGTQENLNKLEKGEVQLATAQADIATESRARSVAVLYSDSFQLVVKSRSAIAQFSDLKGKRIALPQQGGQFRSFLEVAEHYGLAARDFTFIGTNQEDANNAFRQNQVDAMFRVRALGNKTVADMVQQYQGKLIAIDQAAAMKIKHPAFDAGTIPKGVYRGNNPIVPETDLPTITVQRTLLASNTVDDQVIKDITTILDNSRQDIANKVPTSFGDVKPLVASISKPSTTGSNSVALHPGALAYYDRDKPSFIQEYADFVALILTVILLLGSWTWELKNWIERGKKDEADRYIETAIHLMTQVQNSQKLPDPALDELDRGFALAATALINEKISEESFRTLSEAYKAVRDVIEYKRQQTQRPLKVNN